MGESRINTAIRRYFEEELRYNFRYMSGYDYGCMIAGNHLPEELPKP